MSTYVFEKPLIRGTMLKRKSQFTALVDIAGEELIAHIPTTNRIGDVENKNLPCLLSYHDDPKRKLKYDIEAVLLSDDENWIGINQILSNRLVEFFFNEHELDEIVSDFDSVQREVNLGISKLDFKVGDTYLEVKTPLTTINVKYGKDIKTLPPKPFSSTDRMVKHLKELAVHLRIMRRLFFFRSISTASRRGRNGSGQRTMKRCHKPSRTLLRQVLSSGRSRWISSRKE